MRFLLGFIAVSLMPITAQAQDMAADYAAAHAIFGGTVSEMEATQAAIAELIPTLEGRWIPIDLIVGGSPDAETAGSFDAEAIERFCRSTILDLQQNGLHSFTMIQRSFLNTDTPELTYHYGYTGMNSFQRYADETEMLARLGIGDGDDIPQTFYFGSRNYARINLYMTAPDLMVMTHSNGMAEYFARCPADK